MDELKKVKEAPEAAAPASEILMPKTMEMVVGREVVSGLCQILAIQTSQERNI